MLWQNIFMKKNFFIIFSIFLLSSCGYESYSECHKSEMQKNNGVDHSSLRTYCRDLFPRKKLDLITFRENLDYKVSYKDESSWVTVENLTRDKFIHEIRSYGFVAENCNDKTKNPVVNLEKTNVVKRVNIGPGKSVEELLKDRGDNCLYILVKGMKDNY